MIFFFLTFNLALSYWLFLIRSRITLYFSAYSILTGLVALAHTIVSIVLISFREIDIRNGVYYGGIDAPAYQEIYESANRNFLESLSVQFYEPGYSSIAWFFSSYIGSYQIYQIFVYLFFYLTVYFIVEKLRVNIYTLLTLFLLSFFIVASLNTLRIIISVFIGFYVIYHLNKNQFFKSILLASVALSIHISSIVLFIIIFFYYLYLKYGKIIYFLMYLLFIFFISYLFLFLIPPLLEGTRWGAYNENNNEFSLNTFIISAIIVYLTLNRYKEMINYNSFNKVLILALPTIFFILPIFYQYPIGYRFLLFYLPYIYFLLPSIFYVYSPKLRKNIIYIPFLLSIIFYAFIKIYLFFSIEVNSAGVFEIII